MAKWRKKPVVIDAEPYKEGLEDGFIETCNNGNMPYIDTLEGMHLIFPTDMIITGVKGERYPCKLDIFEMTYERVVE